MTGKQQQNGNTKEKSRDICVILNFFFFNRPFELLSTISNKLIFCEETRKEWISKIVETTGEAHQNKIII